MKHETLERLETGETVGTVGKKKGLREISQGSTKVRVC